MGSARTANRAADRAWLRLSCCALKLTDIVTPEATGPRLRANAGTVANHIGSTAVPEYGPTEIFPPVGAMSPRHARLCRPRRLPHRARPREKPGFLTREGEIPRDTDSPLKGTEFEPSVPLLRKALLGVANRRRRHERRSHLRVQVRNGNACLEWLPIAFPFVEGPRVRIRLPPAESLHREVQWGVQTAPKRPRWL
jgi:hypothetical protein